MKIPESIYVLKPDLYDPRFNGFVWPDAPSLLGLEEIFCDFDVENGGYLDWKPRRLQAVWKPLKVKGRVAPFNDYPCLELKTPVFSRRAVDALGSMLTDNGEVLPLISDVGQYFAYVCLTKLDALDQKKSRIERPDRPGTTAFDIEYFVFDKKKLTDAAIFRVPEHPRIYLVSDAFKARAEEAGLNGLHFIKVWPIPKDVEWRMERRKNSKGVKLAGEAFILRFRLKKDKPSTTEKKRAKEIEESLRDQLKVDSLEDKYYGTVEVSEFADGEFRIFCSCPSCEELADYLADWLPSVPWDYDFDIVKRYGHLYDAKAKEKRISIKKVSQS